MTATWDGIFWQIAWVVVPLILGVMALAVLTGARYIPNNRVGVLEKLWSMRGSVPSGRIIALGGEAGIQADVLRGGLHFGRWIFQYRVHLVPLVTIPQGRIGYVYARDGQSLGPSQAMGRVVTASDDFQDACAFLAGEAGEEVASTVGQRGRQRKILREGVYAINLGLFVVITDEIVYRLDAQSRAELQAIVGWQKELAQIEGFSPVVVGGPVAYNDPLDPGRETTVDGIGIVTVQDGPTLGPGEIIAPAAGVERSDKNFHNNYQDPEAFLRAGGFRGRQYIPLTDGTYFINRWFATLEMVPKTVVPIGFVGVIVSYYGRTGQDLSGATFRHGERVAEGERGVLERPLGPGKYPFNKYAGSIVLVPTTNFVLHWVTGKTESHRYDESLRSIDLVTKDAYEPALPLSVVVHIDYQKAPSVIQRFGDVKKLITQTLDPMLSAYFRDVAHRRTMLELLHDRDSIQREACAELRARFGQFDIECVDVLIGKPDTAEAGGKIETLLEQLRLRQLSIEQIETFGRQRAAAVEQQTLNEAQAEAAMQAQLTASLVQVRIAQNDGEASLARARKQAEQVVVTAQAESQQRVLAGRGEGSRLLQVGLSEAAVLLRKVQSYSDPRLFALAMATERLAESRQPLVPERVFLAGGTGGSSGEGASSLAAGAGQGVLGLLLNLLVAEKSGFALADDGSSATLQEFADRMTREAMASMPQASEVEAIPTATVPEVAPASGLAGNGVAANRPQP